MASGWASTSVLGMLVFGLMTIFLGLLLLPGPYSSALTGAHVGGVQHGLFFSISGIVYAAYGTAVLLALAGLLSVFQGRLFWGSTFLGYAAFWGVWGYSTHHFGFGTGYGEAAFAFLWLLFTLTFLISSIKHGWVTFFAYLFLFVAFILLVVAFWQIGAGTAINASEAWAFGGELIATGIIWWYAATAELTNHTFGRKLLPGAA